MNLEISQSNKSDSIFQIGLSPWTNKQNIFATTQ